MDGKFASDGKLYGSLCSRIDALGNHGARAILWDQGESDPGQARGGYPLERQISGKQYFVFFKTLVRSLSTYGGGRFRGFQREQPITTKVTLRTRSFVLHSSLLGTPG